MPWCLGQHKWHDRRTDLSYSLRGALVKRVRHPEAREATWATQRRSTLASLEFRERLRSSTLLRVRSSTEEQVMATPRDTTILEGLDNQIEEEANPESMDRIWSELISRGTQIQRLHFALPGSRFWKGKLRTQLGTKYGSPLSRYQRPSFPGLRHRFRSLCYCCSLLHDKGCRVT